MLAFRITLTVSGYLFRYVSQWKKRRLIHQIINKSAFCITAMTIHFSLCQIKVNCIMTFPCSQHFNTELFTVQHCFFSCSLSHTQTHKCVLDGHSCVPIKPSSRWSSVTAKRSHWTLTLTFIEHSLAQVVTGESSPSETLLIIRFY